MSGIASIILNNLGASIGGVGALSKVIAVIPSIVPIVEMVRGPKGGSEKKQTVLTIVRQLVDLAGDLGAIDAPTEQLIDDVIEASVRYMKAKQAARAGEQPVGEVSLDFDNRAATYDESYAEDPRAREDMRSQFNATDVVWRRRDGRFLVMSETGQPPAGSTRVGLISDPIA